MFLVAYIFTGKLAAFVNLQTTANDIEEVLPAKCDDIPEVALCMNGGMSDVKEKLAAVVAGIDLRRFEACVLYATVCRNYVHAPDCSFSRFPAHCSHTARC